MSVYLIHFAEPYKHAQHYLGFVDGAVERRIARHREGRGARLLDVVQKAGISWELVRVWAGADRTFERRLKQNGHVRRLCPVCSALPVSPPCGGGLSPETSENAPAPTQSRKRRGGGERSVRSDRECTIRQVAVNPS